MMLANHAVIKINKKKANERKHAKHLARLALDQKMKDLGVKVKAGTAPTSGADIYALHPCADPSPYPPTNGKQTNNKRAFRARDYRFPEGHIYHPHYKRPPPLSKEDQAAVNAKAVTKKLKKLKSKERLKKSPLRKKKMKIYFSISAKAKVKKDGDKGAKYLSKKHTSSPA